MESGVVPWRKSWSVNTGLPRNLVSRKLYRGVHVLLLMGMNYESPFWLTFNQARQLKGSVRKGEKACPVVFWKEIKTEDKTTGDEKKVRLLRIYYVFNEAQCEGLKHSPNLSDQLGTQTLPRESVEQMPKRPAIKHGMASAFYSPEEDLVGVPYAQRFTTEEEYYSTLFHELVHSTGHATRLDRPTITKHAGFGTDPYCKEELIAEIGAAFLCASARIEDRTIANSAAYLQGWLGRLKSDSKFIVQAAAQAQQAADFILRTEHSTLSPPLSPTPDEHP